MSINTNVADGGDGSTSRVLQNWDTSNTDKGGYVEPVDAMIGADLDKHYSAGFVLAISQTESTFGNIFEVSMVGFSILGFWLFRIGGL